MSLLQVLERTKQKIIERRRSKRRRVQSPAMIDMGCNLGRDAGLRSCTVCDMSEEGARIAVTSPETVPAEFWLIIPGVDTVQRRCRVMWRSAEHLGVSYVLAPMQRLLD